MPRAPLGTWPMVWSRVGKLSAVTRLTGDFDVDGELGSRESRAQRADEDARARRSTRITPASPRLDPAPRARRRSPRRAPRRPLPRPRADRPLRHGLGLPRSLRAARARRTRSSQKFGALLASSSACRTASGSPRPCAYAWNWFIATSSRSRSAGVRSRFASSSVTSIPNAIAACQALSSLGLLTVAMPAV